MIKVIVEEMTRKELWDLFNKFTFLSAKYEDDDRLKSKLYREIADNLRVLHWLKQLDEIREEKCK